jgi:hypothetical protein
LEDCGGGEGGGSRSTSSSSNAPVPLIGCINCFVVERKRTDELLINYLCTFSRRISMKHQLTTGNCNNTTKQASNKCR